MDLDNRALLYALTKVRWADCKHRLALYAIANDQGAELGTILSQQAAGEETGISRTLVRKYFRELVNEGVLERHDGGGPRGHAYKINRAFDEWRVPWFGAHPVMDRDWPIKREKAIGQILLFLCPPEDRKTRSAARPVARLTFTAARAGARLWGATRATGRAADEDLAARPVARLGIGAADEHTIPSNYRPNSLTAEEGARERNMQAEQLLATIHDRGGAPPFGKPATEVRQLVGDGDAGDLIDAVNRAPTGLKVTAYVEIVAQAVARRGLGPVGPPPAPVITEWREADPDEPPLPPEVARAQIQAGREALRSRAAGAPVRETANTGGGA